MVSSTDGNPSYSQIIRRGFNPTFNASNVLAVEHPILEERRDTSNPGRTIYGFAEVDTGSDEAAWLIYVEDESSISFHRQYAQVDGTPTADFVHVWDDRDDLFPQLVLDNFYSGGFNGSSSVANGGDIHQYDNADAFSISLWVKPQNVAAQRCLFAKATNDANVYGYILYHNSSGQPFLQMRASGTNRQYTFSTLTLTASVWQMVTFTYAGGSNISGAKCYVNTTVGGTPSSGTLNSYLAAQDFTVGARNTAFNFSGNIDHMTVWDKELSSTEVTELYNGGVIFNPINHSAATLNLQSWYRFGDDDVDGTFTDNIGSDDLTETDVSFDLDVP